MCSCYWKLPSGLPRKPIGSSASDGEVDSTIAKTTLPDKLVATPNAELIPIALDSLYVGKMLNHPVFNRQGVLLLAAGMEVSAMPFVMVLMLAASYSFVNPAGFQTNLMVQKPGGYTFMDFAKVGLPLTVLVGVVVCVLTPVFFPFALP